MPGSDRRAAAGLHRTIPALPVRDDAVLHLWGATDALFAELQAAEVLHDVSRAGVTATDFGTREFATLDTDGNLLTFFRRNE